MLRSHKYFYFVNAWNITLPVGNVGARYFKLIEGLKQQHQFSIWSKPGALVKSKAFGSFVFGTPWTYIIAHSSSHRILVCMYVYPCVLLLRDGAVWGRNREFRYRKYVHRYALQQSPLHNPTYLIINRSNPATHPYQPVEDHDDRGDSWGESNILWMGQTTCSAELPLGSSYQRQDDQYVMPACSSRTFNFFLVYIWRPIFGIFQDISIPNSPVPSSITLAFKLVLHSPSHPDLLFTLTILSLYIVLFPPGLRKDYLSCQGYRHVGCVAYLLKLVFVQTALQETAPFGNTIECIGQYRKSGWYATFYGCLLWLGIRSDPAVDLMHNPWG